MSYRNIQIIYLILDELFIFYSNFESLKLKKNFFNLQLCWVFVAAQVFLQLQEAGATLQLCGSGFPLWWLLLLQSAGSRACKLQQLQHMSSVVAALRLQSTGSTVVVHRLSCFAACGIFLGQGCNPCLLHWWEDSLPPSHQGSPCVCVFQDQSSSSSFLSVCVQSCLPFDVFRICSDPPWLITDIGKHVSLSLCLSILFAVVQSLSRV